MLLVRTSSCSQSPNWAEGYFYNHQVASQTRVGSLLGCWLGGVHRYSTKDKRRLAHTIPVLVASASGMVHCPSPALPGRLGEHSLPLELDSNLFSWEEAIIDTCSNSKTFPPFSDSCLERIDSLGVELARLSKVRFYWTNHGVQRCLSLGILWLLLQLLMECIRDSCLD